MILITGTCGFIGFHTAKFFLEKGYKVFGLDNINNYYDTALKVNRNDILKTYSEYEFFKTDIEKFDEIKQILSGEDISVIIHLAAAAGVRYSLENPFVYGSSNVMGTISVLELAKEHNIKKLIYASSSSVYGNEALPFNINKQVNRPVSLYGATKLANELMVYSYFNNYKIPSVGLRFFTVYGPWGRPDMAYFSFMNSIINNKTINLYNYGEMKRSYTYISDVVEAIFKCTQTEYPGYKIYNIGNPKSIQLIDMVNNLELISGKKAVVNYLPMISADVKETKADITETENDIGFKPTVDFYEGLVLFYDWYKSYYDI